MRKTASNNRCLFRNFETKLFLGKQRFKMEDAFDPKNRNQQRHGQEIQKVQTNNWSIYKKDEESKWRIHPILQREDKKKYSEQ